MIYQACSQKDTVHVHIHVHNHCPETCCRKHPCNKWLKQFSQGWTQETNDLKITVLKITCSYEATKGRTYEPQDHSWSQELEEPL